MWKPDRAAADRRGHRYPSDLTDAEYAVVEPKIPPARHGGRKRSVNVRASIPLMFDACLSG
jgi:transposase